MTLRRKLLATIIIITILTILSIALITQFILLDQIQYSEEKNAGQELQGLVWIINERIRSEEITAIDWSNWDDTYRFVQDGNEEFIRSSLVDETYFMSKVNIMLFLNESGNIVHGRAFDLKEQKEIPIPEDFRQNLIDHGILYNNTADFESSAGLLVLNDSIMLVSAHTILKSTGEGPAKGILIRASYIDPEAIAGELGSNAESFLIKGPSNINESSDCSLEEGQITYYINGECFPVESGRIEAVTTLDDIYGEPLLLQINLERSIYNRGVTVLFYIITVIVVIGIISALIYLIIIRKSVISQLEVLGKDAGEIADSKDAGRRVDFEGDPEFMHLADSINKMLSSLEDATNEKIESEMKYADLFSSSFDGIVLTDLEGIILDSNPAFIKMSGITPEPGDETGPSVSFFRIINKNCDLRAIEKILDRWEDEKKFMVFETEIKNFKDGLIPVEITAWPLTDDDGIIRGLWWYVRDLSEKKEIEKIKRNALSRIEDNLENMAILNDEIRNPLAIIVGLAEMKCGAASKEIIRQVEQIDEIINLLDRGWLSSKKVHEFLKKQDFGDEFNKKH